MRITSLVIAIMVGAIGLSAQVPRRSGGNVTLVILVTEASGTPVGGVRVTLSGPVARESRTELGKLAFEGLPSGSYHLRFERDGFVPIERDVVARGGAPIDVKVTLARTPKPPPPSPPLRPVAPLIDTEPVAIDIPSYIERNFVGRAAGKVSSLACSSGGGATLIQLHEPVADHVHTGADEFLYVIAGEGTARTGGSQQVLRAGVFVLVPRGVSHSLTASGRSPLVVLSIKAGERCTPNAG